MNMMRLMANKIHITTARKMLDSGNPVDIQVFAKDGRVLRMNNCVSLRYDFRAGIRRIKLLDSRQIRTIRDVCLYTINDLEVFL